MITKKQFIDFITSFKEFEEGINRFDCAITGRSYPTILFETDWYEAVGKLLDIFLDTHFTEEGCEVLTWWLFEDVDHIIYDKPNLFSEGKNIEYDINDIEDLWNYLLTFKDWYLK